jgi:hypothetical protein
MSKQTQKINKRPISLENEMGTKIYHAVPEDIERKIRRIISQASIALSKAYGIHVKDEDRSAFNTWFGNGDKNHVQNVLHRMNYAMTNGTINIYYNTVNCTINTNAVAYQPAHGWKLATVKQAASDLSIFQLDICPRLINSLTFLGSDNQSQEVTFLHEISHLLGDTLDEVNTLKNNIAYGAAEAKLLAKRNSHLAITNAENYGFYISSFI